MKNNTIKTVSITLVNHRKPSWIFDVSDKMADKIMLDLDSPSKLLQIENVPTKTGTMTLSIQKERIEYVTVE